MLYLAVQEFIILAIIFGLLVVGNRKKAQKLLVMTLLSMLKNQDLLEKSQKYLSQLAGMVVLSATAVCWMLLLFYPFIAMVDGVMPGSIHQKDVTAQEIAVFRKVQSLEAEGMGDENIKKAIVDLNIPLHLSLFHTLFNLCNIGLLIGFSPHLGRLAVKLVNPRTSNGKEPVPGSLASIHYEGSGLLPKTGELNLALVEAEVNRLAAVTRYMFEGFVEIFEHPEEDKGPFIKELIELEDKCDGLAFEITQTLIYCTTESLAGESALHVTSLLRVTAELEDIGDCCHRLVQLAHRKYRKQRILPEETKKEIKIFSEQILDFMELYQTHLKDKSILPDMAEAEQIEQRIDASRKMLRKGAVKRMKESENVKAEMIYVDILNEMERIGNDALNIVQALNHVV